MCKTKKLETTCSVCGKPLMVCRVMDGNKTVLCSGVIGDGCSSKSRPCTKKLCRAIKLAAYPLALSTEMEYAPACSPVDPVSEEWFVSRRIYTISGQVGLWRRIRKIDKEDDSISACFGDRLLEFRRFEQVETDAMITAMSRIHNESQQAEAAGGDDE